MIMHNSLIENYRIATNISKTQPQIEKELNSLSINTPVRDLIVNNNLSESVISHTSKTQPQIEKELNSLSINTPVRDLSVNIIDNNLSESVINDTLEAPKMEISTFAEDTGNLNSEAPAVTLGQNNKTPVEEPDITKEDLILPEQYNHTLSTLPLDNITKDDLETTD